MLQVQCTLCDVVKEINDDSFQAKRLRNRRRDLYLCDTCYNRITENTLKRHATGKFRLFHIEKNDDGT